MGWDGVDWINPAESRVHSLGLREHGIGSSCYTRGWEFFDELRNR